MAKRKAATYMTAGEQIAGVVFFVIYLLVLPFAAQPMFQLAGKLLGLTISGAVQNMIYYYVLFAVTIIIFHGFLGRTSRHFADNLGGACKTLVIGLIGLYGLNELVFRLTNLLFTNHTNLNDTTISATLCRGGAVPGVGIRQPEKQEPGGGISGELFAVCAAACVAVRSGESGHHILFIDDPIPCAGACAGLGL